MYIIIIGCGRLGSELARELSDGGHDVAVVDRDPKRLAALGSGFNGQVVRGVEFDGDVLEQAGIRQADYLLAVTPDDSVNITVCLAAGRIYHVRRIIARISSPAKAPVYETLGIETVHPTRLAVDLLTRKIGGAET